MPGTRASGDAGVRSPFASRTVVSGRLCSVLCLAGRVAVRPSLLDNAVMKAGTEVMTFAESGAPPWWLRIMLWGAPPAIVADAEPFGSRACRRSRSARSPTTANARGGRADQQN